MEERYKLYQGDYLEVIKGIPDKSIDLLITDPPYIHEKGGRGKMLLGESLDRTKFNIKKMSDFGKEQIYDFLNTTKRIMKKPQWYIFCSEKQIPYYLNWTLENKFKFNILTWNKPLSIMNRERYSTNIEYIIRIYSKGCALNKLDLEKDKSKTSYYSKYKVYSQIRGKQKLHPSQKPTEIIQEIIELSSNKNDLILDPFMGSGTTGRVCLDTNRKFIGIELDGDYFNIAKNRIEEVLIDKGDKNE